MFTLLVATTVLVLLYGLAWHDQPPRERESAKLRPADDGQTKTS